MGKFFAVYDWDDMPDVGVGGHDTLEEAMAEAETMRDDASGRVIVFEVKAVIGNK